MTARFAVTRSKWVAGLVLVVGVSFGTQAALAEVVTGAGPGAGPNVKSKSGGGTQKAKDDKHKDQIEIQSYSLGHSSGKGKVELGSLKAGASENSPKKPDKPDNTKTPDGQKPAALLVPAVQKVREAASSSKQEDGGKKK
jgi:hypothetical protein